MGSFQNPIGQKPNDPYENYRAEAIERDKREKEERKNGDRSPKKRWDLIAYFLDFVAKVADWLEKSAEQKKPLQTSPEAVENLRNLKKALLILEGEDLSQDAEFLQLLSDLWRQLLESSLDWPRDSEATRELKALVKAVQSYPHDQEHTLGYYLTEHAGEKWLPFPYMELIQKLQIEYRQNKADCALTQWIAHVDALIRLLGSP